MAKISLLPSAGPLNGTEFLPGVQDGETVRIGVEQFLQSVDSSSGQLRFFDTLADAVAGIGGLIEGEVVEILADESQADERTRYRLEGGVLVLKATLGYLRRDGSNVDDPAAFRAFIGAIAAAVLLASTGSGLVGFSHANAYPAGTLGRHARAAVFVTDAPYNAAGDNAANDSPAFLAAVAALPASGGEIFVPSAVGYKLDQDIPTGTKKVVWRFGAGTITCPPGEFALNLQSNGSQVIGAGRGSTIFKLRAPAAPLVMPTVTTARTGGALTTATVAGGSGFVTTPVAIVANSPVVVDIAANDAAVIATVSGGTVSSLAIVAAGADYAANPPVTFVGGGAGAVKIDNVQSCVVRDFSIDFSNVPNSTGVYHYGGWFAHISNIDRVYNVATGVSSEHATSIGYLVDSHTDGVPGPNGAYGGAYVCNISCLFFNKMAMIGHDTSTGTTFQFTSCDFKTSYIHGCVGITLSNPVQQATAGTPNFHLVNVDGLLLLGGDIEDAGMWFHVHGSCNNIRIINTLTGSASGPIRRGPLGVWVFDPANPLSTITPWRSGSAGALGSRFEPIGWNGLQHGLGSDWAGDTYTGMSTNIKPTSRTQAKLFDKTASGVMVETSTGGVVRGRMGYASPDAVIDTFDLFEFDAAGLTLPVGRTYKVDGVPVLGARVAGAPGAATDAATTQALANWLRGLVLAHGLGGA